MHTIGGGGEPYPLPSKGVELSGRVAKLLGLEIAGIDLLFSGDSYVLREANSSPGFKAFETSCKVNVAGKIGEYVVQRLKSRISKA